MQFYLMKTKKSDRKFRVFSSLERFASIRKQFPYLSFKIDNIKINKLQLSKIFLIFVNKIY